jgi:hypothetical protein
MEQKKAKLKEILNKYLIHLLDSIIYLHIFGILYLIKVLKSFQKNYSM